MDTYRENFIQRMHRLENEVNKTDTPVGFENIIDEAIKTIRHFSMSRADLQIEKEKQKRIDDLIALKKNIMAGITHVRKSVEEENIQYAKTAADIKTSVRSFIDFISDIQ